MHTLQETTMANNSKHKSTEYTKLLLVGDRGAGKTSALASLANAGYNLRILDFDDGLSILPEFLDDNAVKNVSYITLRDGLGQANAFRKGVQMITNWKDGDEDFPASASSSAVCAAPAGADDDPASCDGTVSVSISDFSEQ